MVIPLFLVCYKNRCASIFVVLIVVFTILHKHLFTENLKSLCPRFTMDIYANKLGDARFCTTPERSSGQQRPQPVSLIAPKAKKPQQWFP